MKKAEVDHNAFKDGPFHDRRCTDTLCCLIFFAFLAAMLLLGYYGYQNGDPDSVIYPYDSAGNQCGRPGKPTETYEYVYFLNPSDNTTSTRWKVCVKSCPTKNSNTTTDCYVNQWVTNCSFVANGTNYAPYASYDLLHRVCMPEAVTDYFRQYLSDNEMMSFGADVIRCKYIVLAVLGISVGVSIIYLLFLRYFIGVVVWMIVSALVLLFALFGGYYNYQIFDEKNGMLDQNTIIQYWCIAIGCYLAAFLSLCIAICLRNRIGLAAAIMKSATIFIDDVWSVLFIPIIFFILSVAIFFLWITALIYLYSSGTIEVNSSTTDTNSVIAQFTHDQQLKNAMWFEFLGIFWINSFKVALLQFIISFACLVWYFTINKADLNRPISRGVTNGLVFHLGSLAYGSLLLTIVVFFKWFLTLMSKIYKDSEGSNAIVVCICKCVFCCVQCFDRFIKFLDHQAYIRIALTGENFCEAAQKSFEMIWENAGRFTALGGVGTVFNFLGKASITCSSAYLGFLIITTDENYKSQINSAVGPTVVFAIVSYCIACLFMGVYEISADTIVQAFILDEKMNGINKTKYAPQPIKEFMEDHSKDN